MSVRICDAIMGSGKSSAAITYINENPGSRFVYITPYLDEARRIIDSCPSLNFVSPSKNVPGTGFTKTGHTAQLLAEGRNIASTHQAFKYYTEDMLEDIRRYGYTLFIDESIEAVEEYDGSLGDLGLLVRAGHLQTDGERYWVVDDSYDGEAHRSEFRLLKSRELIRYVNEDDEEKESCAFWSLPPQLLECFQDVFVLTYLFSGQGIHHMLMMHNIPYEFIGVAKDRETGAFRFSHETSYMPEAAGRLAEMIHICDHGKLNIIGNNPYALSKNWYKKGRTNVDKIKNHLNTYFRRIMTEHCASERMWGVYSELPNKLAGKGYKTKYVVFNERATNKYSNRTVLAYPVNLFMNASLKSFYNRHGANVSDDDYALSTMIQWIWRSAIRDGKEIYLYLPSSRMRKLLVDWMESVRLQYEQWQASQTEGGDQVA